FFFLTITSGNLLAQTTAEQITELRRNWTKLLIGDGNMDSTDPIVAAYIKDVDEKAAVVWNTMVKKPTGTDNRTHIFADLPITSKDRTGSSQITFTFDRLKALALAYKLSGTSFFNRQDVFDEIVAALDMMVAKHYSLANSTSGTGTSLGSGSAYGNWYDWRIGTPLRYNDLLLILADDLTPTQISTYVAPVLSNNKAVDNTGANRTWIAGIVAQAGILLNREDLITMAKNGLKPVFSYVTSGDGYYVDGSFVQHTNYAYTGGYGKALLCTISPLMYILKGSPWEISYTDKAEQIFYDMIFQAYEPLIYDGRFVDMVREREISRLANQDNVPGRQAIRAIILLLDVLEGEQKARAEKMVKEWLQDEEVLAQVCFDPNDGFLEYTLSVGMLTKALDVADNNEITPRGKRILHQRFASMDRTMHIREDYAFGLAMTSTRIKNTEGTNDEGLRLWHIGDGMTYLYNEDKDTYADHFWATVDYQRLPGTTVVRAARGKKDGYGTFNPYTWVGGTNMEEYGVAGMQFKGLGISTTRTLDAKKSWFMFDDEIVALGSGIKLATGNAPVETIIENRKINRDFSNDITLNGDLMVRTGGGGEIVRDNNVLKTATTATTAYNVVPKYTFDETVTGRVTFEYDIKLPAVNNFLAVRIYGRGNNDATDKLLNFSTMREGMYAQRISAVGATAQDACSADATVVAGEWHRVKIELDMDAGKYNYYFDGKHITTATAISGNSNTVNADLANRNFIEALSGSNAGLTAFDILTPKNGIGTILIDNIKVTSNDQVVYEEDFENYEEGSIANQKNWSIGQTDLDTNVGAGSFVFNDQTIELSEPVQDAFNELHEGVEWIHLKGSGSQKTDIGYYFPNKASVRGLRETRTGSWDLVNTYFKFIDTETRTNNFVTFWFEHGNAPQNESYSYVLLPGKSKEEIENYKDNPDIEILKQDDAIHAVRENGLGITAINFWTKGTFDIYTVSAPASLMIKNGADGLLEISISDPTQRASLLNLDIDKAFVEEVFLSDGVTVNENAGKCRLTVNVSKSAGKSFFAKIKVKDITGIQNVENKGDVKIYPNPLKGNQKLYFEINESSIADNLNLSIYNTLGYKVKEQAIRNRTTEIDWNDAPGTYIICYGDVKKKLIIQ
ncbi:MAG: polysaccharide lyase beta-sandwich domain-containing protein, partial [Bacteroidales bacterium]|nr:polysaccharide lyase beta-sandwich domain-containing protein [Bacteroidales bacterium]